MVIKAINFTITIDLILEDTILCSLYLTTEENCVVDGIYRPPSVDEAYNANLLEKTQLVVSRYQNNVLIVGVLYLLDLLKSEIPPANFLDHEFQEMFYEIPLYNHISSSTRFRCTNTPSIFYLVLTSEENIRYESLFVKSDHVIIAFDYISEGKRASDAKKLIGKIDTVAVMKLN